VQNDQHIVSTFLVKILVLVELLSVTAACTIGTLLFSKASTCALTSPVVYSWSLATLLLYGSFASLVLCVPLLSVLFPVPITVYSVDWRLPSGMPIRFRTEGVPVQGEVAFDPFAMMDEQLDSAFTTLHLRPEPVHRYERKNTGEMELVQPHRILETPAIPMPEFCQSERVQVRKVEYIGCCGFPWPTGGRQCVYEPEFIDHLETGSPNPDNSDKSGSNSSRTATGSTILESGVGMAAAAGAAVSIGKSTEKDDDEEEPLRGRGTSKGAVVGAQAPRSGILLATSTPQQLPAARSPLVSDGEPDNADVPALLGEEVSSTKFSI